MTLIQASRPNLAKQDPHRGSPAQAHASERHRRDDSDFSDSHSKPNADFEGALAKLIAVAADAAATDAAAGRAEVSRAAIKATTDADRIRGIWGRCSWRGLPWEGRGFDLDDPGPVP